MRSYKEIELWKDITDEQWSSWEWQVKTELLGWKT
jgi:lysine 2,3-aminomutase